jgi:hypothetical protein
MNSDAMVWTGVVTCGVEINRWGITQLCRRKQHAENTQRGIAAVEVYRGVARGVDGDPVAATVGVEAEVGGREELEAPEHEDGGEGQQLHPRPRPRRRLDVAVDDALRLLRSLAPCAGSGGGRGPALEAFHGRGAEEGRREGSGRRAVGMVFELQGRRRRGVCRRVRRSWCDAGLAGFSLFFFLVGSWILWRSGGSIYVYVPRFRFYNSSCHPKKRLYTNAENACLVRNKRILESFFLRENSREFYEVGFPILFFTKSFEQWFSRSFGSSPLF